MESNNIDELELGLTFTDVADDLGIFRPPAQEVELCAGGSEQEVTGEDRPGTMIVLTGQ